MKTMETSRLIANEMLIQLAKDVIKYADDVAWQNKQLLSDVLLAAVWCCLNQKLPLSSEDIESNQKDSSGISNSDEIRRHERDKVSESKANKAESKANKAESKANKAQTSSAGNQQYAKKITDTVCSNDKDVSKSDLLCSVGLSAHVCKENPKDKVSEKGGDGEKDTSTRKPSATEVGPEGENLDSMKASFEVDNENFGESEVISIDDDDDDHGDDMAALEGSEDTISMQNENGCEPISELNKILPGEPDYFDMSCEEIDEEGAVDNQTRKDTSLSAAGLESVKKKPQQNIKTEKVSDDDVILIGSDDEGEDQNTKESSKQGKDIESCTDVAKGDKEKSKDSNRIAVYPVSDPEPVNIAKVDKRKSKDSVMTEVYPVSDPEPVKVAKKGKGKSKDSNRTDVYPVSGPEPVIQTESNITDSRAVYLSGLNLRQSEDDGNASGYVTSEISQGTSGPVPVTLAVQSISSAVTTSYDSLHTESEAFGGCKELYPGDVTDELDQKPILVSCSDEEQNYPMPMQGGPPAKKRLLDFDKKWHMVPKHTELQDRYIDQETEVVEDIDSYVVEDIDSNRNPGEIEQFFAQATEVDIKIEDDDSNGDRCEIVSYWGNFEQGNYMLLDEPTVGLENVENNFIDFVHFSDSNVEQADAYGNEDAVPMTQAGIKNCSVVLHDKVNSPGYVAQKCDTRSALGRDQVCHRGRSANRGKFCGRGRGGMGKKTGYHSAKVGASNNRGHGRNISSTRVGDLRKKEDRNNCERDKSFDYNGRPYDKKSYSKMNVARADCRGEEFHSKNGVEHAVGKGKVPYPFPIIRKVLSKGKGKQSKVHWKKCIGRTQAKCSAVDISNQEFGRQNGNYNHGITNGTGRENVGRGHFYGTRSGTIHCFNALKQLALKMPDQDFNLNTDGNARGSGLGRGFRRGRGRPRGSGKKRYLAPPGGVEANSIEPGPSRKRKPSSSLQTFSDEENLTASYSNSSSGRGRKRHYKRSSSKSEETHNHDSDSELSENSDSRSEKRSVASAKSGRGRGRKITVGRKMGNTGGKVDVHGTRKCSVSVNRMKVVPGGRDASGREGSRGSRGKRIGFYSRLLSKGRGRGGKTARDGELSLARGLLSRSLKKQYGCEGQSEASDSCGVSGGGKKNVKSQKRGGKVGNGSTRGRGGKTSIEEEEDSEDEILVID